LFVSEGEKPARRGAVVLRWRSAVPGVVGAGVAGFGVAALSGVHTSFSQPLATVLAGAGALGAGALAYLNGQRTRDLDETHHRAEMARERERHRDDSHRARESALRDRYAAVAAQIAHDSAAIRQAGVYALTALADDWHAFGEDDERQVCINLLQWYLRVPFPVANDLDKPHLSEREIRQTILGILIQRWRRPVDDLKSWASTVITLDKVSLPTCGFSNFDFTGLSLSGVNLVGADLTGANLGGVDLTGANLGFVDLRGTNLSGANLVGADLTGANLGGMDLRGTNLSGANLGGTNLKGANLGGMDLRGTNLIGADLVDTDPASPAPISANLRGADLSNANLAGENLGGVDLYSAGLRNADLRNADLGGANLGGADLRGAKLSGAYLRADLSAADLSGADLSGASLSGASLSGARYSKSTLWPTGFTPTPMAAG